MSQNLISFQLSATDVTAIDGALKTLEEKLVGLIGLSTEQRSKLMKMGHKSEAFCRERVPPVAACSPPALLLVEGLPARAPARLAEPPAPHRPGLPRQPSSGAGEMARQPLRLLARVSSCTSGVPRAQPQHAADAQCTAELQTDCKDGRHRAPLATGFRLLRAVSCG